MNRLFQNRLLHHIFNAAEHPFSSAFCRTPIRPRPSLSCRHRYPCRLLSSSQLPPPPSSPGAPLESMEDLTIKKCVPCHSKDIRAMSEQSANELLQQLQGWDLANEGGMMRLHRSWKVKSFMKGLEFFQLVAEIAEAEGHHPDLHLVGWNNVKIEIWTHVVVKRMKASIRRCVSMSVSDTRHELFEGYHFCQAQREDFFQLAKPYKEHSTILRM